MKLIFLVDCLYIWSFLGCWFWGFFFWFFLLANSSGRFPKSKNNFVGISWEVYKHVRGWDIIIYNISVLPSCGPPWLRTVTVNVLRICYFVFRFYHHSGFIVTAVQMTLKSVYIFLDLQDHEFPSPSFDTNAFVKANCHWNVNFL